MHTTLTTPPNPGGTNPWGDSPNKPDICALNFYGNSLLTSNNHAEMWITILAAPGSAPPMTNCWGLTATVWYDNVGGPPNPQGSGGWNNSKAVGIVTNYNPANKTGLFLAMYDAGNTEVLALVSFDANVNPPGNMINPTVIASKNLNVSSVRSTGDGGSVFNSLAYVMTLNVCAGPAVENGPDQISAYASMFPAVTPYDHSGNKYSCSSPPLSNAPDQQCLVYNGPLPAGILAAGAVGIATLAPTSGAGVVDTYVSKFTFTPQPINPD